MTTNRGGVDPGDSTPHGRMTPSAPPPRRGEYQSKRRYPTLDSLLQPPRSGYGTAALHQKVQAKRASEYILEVAARERELGLAYVRECGDALRSELGLPSAQMQDALQLRDQLHHIIDYYTTQFRLLANAFKPIAAMVTRDTEKMLASLETLGEPA